MGSRGWSRLAGIALASTLTCLILRASLRPPDGGPGPAPAFPDRSLPVGGPPARSGAPWDGEVPGIRGIVLDGEGSPIPGAEVASAGEGERVPARCITGPDGRFLLPVPPGGGERLVGARAAGFAPVVRGGIAAGAGDIRLVLHPGARVEGRVLDAAGAPCPGARVRASLRFPGLGKDLGGFEARTDEEGRYAFDGLAPVEGRLEATCHGKTSGPVAFEVPAGRRIVHEDLVVPLGPSIEGIVRSSDGTPLEGITVAATAPGTRGGTFSRSGPDGRFLLPGLEPLACSVRATDYGGRWAEARIDGVTPPCRDLVLSMGRDPDAPGAYRFRLEVPAGPLPRSIRILEIRDGRSAPCGSSTAVPDGEGMVGPRRLRAGRYRLALRCPAGTAVSEEFAVDHGETADLGTLRLAAPAAVRGRLLDSSGSPAGGARVFVGDDPTPETAAVGADGTFGLQGLPAGTGFLRATLARCEPLVVPWRAGAGETSDLGDLRFRGATGAIRGSVRSRAAKPVAGVRIRISPWDDLGPGADDREVVAGPDGRFETNSLAAGRWGIAVAPPADRGEGGAAFVTEERSRRIDLAEGGQEEVLLEID